MYLRIAYRIRSWGKLPAKRGPSLVISNHQIEIDLMAAMAEFMLNGGWRTPVLTASAKLMYEPGFLALRIPWLWRIFYSTNLGWLFEGLGLLPLENELQSRSIARWAWGVQRRHGALPLDRIFKPAVVERHRLSGMTTRDVFNAKNFKWAQGTYVRISDLLTPHRKESFDEMRAGVDRDLARIEDAMKRGATFYVTPEGEYPTDGAMLPFRGIWDRLAPHAESVYLVAISYDPFVGRKLSQLYRIVPLREKARAVAELKAARPVTTSALIAEWLSSRTSQFTEEEALTAIEHRVRTLPSGLFIDPELAARPRSMASVALQNLCRYGALQRENGALRMAAVRKHPQFPETPDIIAFQARFFCETLEGLEQSHGTLRAPHASMFNGGTTVGIVSGSGELPMK
jgi:hypothetical protein